MTGNITGLGVVISDITRHGIIHISFVISYVYLILSGAGRLFVGGFVDFISFAVLLEVGH